jgi:hypothetical protein
MPSDQTVSEVERNPLSTAFGTVRQEDVRFPKAACPPLSTNCSKFELLNSETQPVCSAETEFHRLFFQSQEGPRRPAHSTRAVRSKLVIGYARPEQIGSANAGRACKHFKIVLLPKPALMTK